MKVSAKLLVKYAAKYGHDVSIIDTSPTESYLVAANNHFPCPARFSVMVSFPISHRYACKMRSKAYNLMLHPSK